MITKTKAKLLFVGCGDVAQRVAARLDFDHYHCYGLRRNTANLPSSIESVSCDLNDHAAVEKAVAPGFDYLVITLTPNQRDEQGYRQTFVTNLGALLRSVQAASYHPKRIVFVSSTSVYHQNQGEWVDENSITEPQNYRGQTIVEAESLCLNSGIAATIVRFSGIYGPGRGRLIDQVREGRWSVQDSQWTNRIHSEDAAAVLAWCLDRARNQQPLDSVYLASDCEPTPKNQVCAWIAKQLAVDEPLETDINQDLNKRCFNRKLLTAGFQFAYPSFREGYRQLLTTFKS